MTDEQKTKYLAAPMRDLGCNCCGNAMRARQWWNRDTGYGICDECIAFVRKQGMSEAEIQDCYGIEGIHWNVQAEVK